MKIVAIQVKLHSSIHFQLPDEGILTKMKKINRYFVSNIDKAIAEFNKTHEKSASQKHEKEKYEEIYSRRDTANETSEDNQDLWD